MPLSVVVLAFANTDLSCRAPWDSLGEESKGKPCRVRGASRCNSPIDSVDGGDCGSEALMAMASNKGLSSTTNAQVDVNEEMSGDTPRGQ